MISRFRGHYDENYNMNRINNINLLAYQKFLLLSVCEILIQVFLTLKRYNKDTLKLSR